MDPAWLSTTLLPTLVFEQQALRVLLTVVELKRTVCFCSWGGTGTGENPVVVALSFNTMPHIADHWGHSLGFLASSQPSRWAPEEVIMLEFFRGTESTENRCTLTQGDY